MQFQFGAPYCVLGEGSSRNIGAYAAGHKCGHVLCVYDPGIKKAGVALPIVTALQAQGLQVTVFEDVVPDPSVEAVTAVGQLARESGVDGIVAIGGGSSIDTAKIAAVLATNPEPVQQFYGRAPIPNLPLPLFAVPTTAGTGSEVTPAAVVSDRQLGRKITLVHERLRPAIAVLDPALTLGLPPMVTAATGMDALSHAVECMTSVLHNPLTDGLALQAIRLLTENLPRCVKDGSDLEARSQVLLAATTAGMAFGNTAAHVGHAMAHAMGMNWHIPHGMACALTLPFAITACAPAAGAQLRLIADAVGISAAPEEKAQDTAAGLSVWARRFAIDLGLPTFRQLDIQSVDMEAIVDASMLERMLQLGGVPVSREMCHGYYEQLFSM